MPACLGPGLRLCVRVRVCVHVILAQTLRNSHAKRLCTCQHTTNRNMVVATPSHMHVHVHAGLTPS